MRNILFILVFLGLQSCVTYQKCVQKFGGDTLVTFKDSAFIIHDTIYVQADTMSGEISLEELLTNDYVKETPKQKTNIALKKGNIEFSNTCKPDTIYWTDTVYIKHTKYVTNHFKDQTVFQKIFDKIKWWHWVILAAVLFAIGYIIKAVKGNKSQNPT